MRLRIASLAILAIVATAVAMKVGSGKVALQQPPSPPIPFVVNYDDQANLDPKIMQEYQSMSAILNGYTGVPENRTTYWAAVINSNDFQITSWQGTITGVQPNANGSLVTVQVIAEATSNTISSICVFTNSDYSEQYQVNKDGTFTYIGSLDPQGLAGQMPAVIGI